MPHLHVYVMRATNWDRMSQFITFYPFGFSLSGPDTSCFLILAYLMVRSIITILQCTTSHVYIYIYTLFATYLSYSIACTIALSVDKL